MHVPFKCKIKKINNLILSLTSHLSGAQELQVADTC